MLRLTVQQMRLSAGRLIAAAVAIVLGTAFVTATLMASATIEQTTYNAVTSRYADADLILESRDAPIDAGTVDAVRATPGIAAADPVTSLGLEATAGGRSEYVEVGPTATHERLTVGEYTRGGMPAAAGQIALGDGLAERLGLTVGDELTITNTTWVPDPDDPDAGTVQTTSRTMTLVGTTAEASGFFFAAPNASIVASELAELTAESWGTAPEYDQVLIALEPDADADGVHAGLAAAADGAAVTTVEDKARQITAELSGNQVLFTVLLLAFATVALAVAALVIANTFQVLVAQRTRTLALLRCVGATKEQVRSSVLVEALVLGLLASLAGLLAGVGAVALGLAVVGNLNLAVPLDRTLHLGVGTVVTVMLTGLVVTLAAALVPARMATRVAPLAALRPLEGEHGRSAGRIRGGIAALLFLGGLALLGGGIAVSRSTALGTEDASLIGLGLGLVGGLGSLSGLLIGAVFVVPRVIRSTGRLLARGVPARIATANAVRNPRRTSATASALIIGVALVTMMSTGALAARESLGSTLDTEFPVDLTVGAGLAGDALTPTQIETVREQPGVSAIVLLSRAEVEVTTPVGDVVTNVAAVSDGELDTVLRDEDLASALTAGTAVVSEQLATWYEIETGDVLAVRDPSGGTLDVEAAVTELGGSVLLLTPETLALIGPETSVNLLWARIADGVDEAGVVREVQTALTELPAGGDVGALEVSGAAVERAAYQQVIDTLLAVVVALLGVAVVIALVGVANTLSLSVLERRRESALLRAMGLTRGQLRGMLAVEGLMIAGTGGLLGVVAGLLYGWAGSAILLGSLGQVSLAVPWRDLGLVAAVALLAGLLASVLPARSAVRTPPVAALAMD